MAENDGKMDLVEEILSRAINGMLDSETLPKPEDTSVFACGVRCVNSLLNLFACPTEERAILVSASELKANLVEMVDAFFNADDEVVSSMPVQRRVEVQTVLNMLRKRKADGKSSPEGEADSG